MGDPLSVTAGVIAVAGLAYSSAKVLKEMIASFSNAPKLLQNIGEDLQVLQSLIQALQQPLDGVLDADLSDDQKACFESLKPALEACKRTCDDFVSKLSKMTSHSRADSVSWWDRARLHFNEKDVALLKSDLEIHKQTVDVTIGVATPYVWSQGCVLLCSRTDSSRKTVSRNHDALQNLEARIATSINNFSGRIMGLETALQSMSVANVAMRQEDVQHVARILNEHARILKLCLESCTIGLKETNKRTGTHVKYAKTFNEARQAIGSMGNVAEGVPPTVVEHAEARDKSIQHVGPMDRESAKSFWTSK